MNTILFDLIVASRAHPPQAITALFHSSKKTKKGESEGVGGLPFKREGAVFFVYVEYKYFLINEILG